MISDPLHQASASAISPATLPPFGVLGAGRVGQALVHDLLASGAERVVLVDADGSVAKAVAERMDDPRLAAWGLDLADAAKLRPLLEGLSAVISAVPYRLNAELAKCVVRAGSSWIDLGGNTEVVEAILGLDAKAKDRGVSVIPDAGLQPGLGNVLAGEVFRRLGGADSLRLLVGGLPQTPQGRLKYQLVFSIEGLVNEYHGEARTLEGGRLRLRRPLSEVEVFPWPGLPELEAFHTSGSASTLPSTFEGRATRVEVKTVRYAGHAAELSAIFEEVPRERRAAYLQEILPSDGPDIVVLRIEGRLGERSITYEMEDRFDPATGFTAMMRTTGFPASIVAQLAARGELPTGAILQERDVPAQPLVDGLRRRGVTIREIVG